jgi:hypothetical protein
VFIRKKNEPESLHIEQNSVFISSGVVTILIYFILQNNLALVFLLVSLSILQVIEPLMEKTTFIKKYFMLSSTLAVVSLFVWALYAFLLPNPPTQTLLSSIIR